MAKILIIDDDKELLKKITRFLKKEGHTVFQAYNGNIGLEVLKKENPDLVLCDILMPEMNGYKFTRIVKNHSVFKYTPVIMLTSLDMFNIQHSAISTGADDYLLKPIDYDQLKLRVIAMERIKQLYFELLEKDKKIQRELDMAQRIQFSFLPGKFPEFKDVAIYSRYYPAAVLSGDLYDVKKVAPGKCFFICADVSGHGVPAALVQSSFRIILSKYLDNYSDDLEKLFFMVNNELTALKIESTFVTATAGVFNFKNNSLQYINAGHPAAILITPEDVKLLKQTSSILGMFPDTHYKQIGIEFSYNDKFLFYTDGLVEIQDPETHQWFRLKNLLSMIKKNRQFPLNLILDIIEEDVLNFKKGYRVNDDVAIIGFSFAGKKEM
ncbi:MAG: SpoIIE family protein phosphatase [Spirochaetes bacterium]|nr:SpoIIE family protein phosphatase [Spirochaetota bacterium]